MIKIMQITIFLIIALLSACTLAPKYERPEAPVAKEWNNQSSQKAARISVAQIEWHHFFQSPQMQQVIQAALDNNRDLRIAIFNIEAAEAMYQTSRADLLPKIQANASQTKQGITEDLSTTNKSYTSTRYDANIGATAFEIDLFGKNRSLKKAAFENYLATKEGQKSAQIALIAATANAYLQFLADKEIATISAKNLAIEKQYLSLVKKAHNVGTKSRLDLNNALARVESAKSTLALYQSLVEQDLNALKLLIGNPNFEPTKNHTTLSKTTMLKELPIQMPSEVLLARPDVKAAEHQLISANANIGAARSAFFPTISLTGSIGFASDELKNLFSSSAAGAWSFTPNVSIPLFEGGKNFANLKIANTNRKIAVANYEKTIQTAFREVADELTKYESLKEQLRATEEINETTKNSYKISTIRHKNGIDNLATKLEYEKLFLNASQNTIEVRRQHMANMVNLYKALGGGQNQE